MIQSSSVLKFHKPSSHNGTALRDPARRRSVKQRLTITLPAELLDRLRNAVYWTPSLTLAGFIESAVAARLDDLEKQHGEPFPTRVEELKGGRPRRIRPVSRDF